MVKIPPAKGVKWTLWWGALDYWRLQVRGLKFEVRGSRLYFVETLPGNKTVCSSKLFSTSHHARLWTISNIELQTSNQPCLLIPKCGAGNLPAQDDNLNEATTALTHSC